MIKINLAKQKGKSAKVKSTSNQASGGDSFVASSDDMASVRSLAIKNLAIILLGPVFLLVYEQLTIPDMQVKAESLNKQLIEVQTKNKKASEAVSQIAKFRKEEEKLKAQITSLEGLRKDRLREVKVLDYIQKDIPDKVWLSKLELLDGKLIINGYALADSDLTQFMDSLSKSAFLKEVSLIRSNDTNSKDYGQVKKFEVACLMERTP